MHTKSAEDLKQLLRRIEEIPNAAPPTPVALALHMPLARPAGSPLRRRRKLAALLLFGAVAIATIVTARSLPRPNEPAADGPPVDVTRTARTAPPARVEQTPPAPAEDAASAVIGAAPAVVEPATAVIGATPAVVEPARVGVGAAPVVVGAAPAVAGAADQAHEQTALLPELRRSLVEPPAHAAPRPTLRVAAIHAASGQRVRVPMRIEPGTFSSKAFRVSVHGLPKGARFVQGKLLAPDRWVIPASALGRLELALGDAVPGQFELVSELQGASGKPIAQTRSALFVTSRGGNLAPSGKSRLAGSSAPDRRISSVANCRPCRCVRASSIYWEYRASGIWAARAGPLTTTCHVTTSIKLSRPGIE